MYVNRPTNCEIDEKISWGLERIREAFAELKQQRNEMQFSNSRRRVAGVTGTMVSKRLLALNFARNEVMQSCPVWNRIRAVLVTARQDALIEKKAPTEEEVAYLVGPSAYTMDYAGTVLADEAMTRGLALVIDCEFANTAFRAIGDYGNADELLDVIFAAHNIRLPSRGRASSQQYDAPGAAHRH